MEIRNNAKFIYYYLIALSPVYLISGFSIIDYQAGLFFGLLAIYLSIYSSNYILMVPFFLSISMGIRLSNLIFSIAGTDYSNEKEILFRHKLIGASDFSTWTKNNFVTYTNLSPGFYKLIIEANNYYGQNLKPFEYEFQITPPWWETSIFYISEICFFILLFLVIIYTKKSSRGSKIATSLIFLVILIIFEIVNTKLDPLVDAVSGGVPVFAFASKIVLALLLEPLVGFSTTMIDKLTGEVKEAA